MKVTPKQYAESLFESLHDKSEKAVKNILNEFVDVLIANNHTSQLDKILDHFTMLWNRGNGIVEAEIKTANKLDSKVIETLKTYVGEIAESKNIQMTEVVDKDLLGGFVVKYEGKIVDNSLKTKLQNFKDNLKR
jgi:F-type H+-transporting ATPase subunit delta